MRQHLSIGVGGELVAAFALQLFAQRRIIFDHAVVHQRDFSALVKMRMRIFVGHFAMSSPACVADAVLPRGRFLGHQFGKVRDPSGAFPRFDLLPVYDGNAGGIVTAIFEPPQTIQKYGRRFCATDISDNSAHNFRREIIAYFRPLALCLGLVDEHAHSHPKAAQGARDLTKGQRCRGCDVPFLFKALRTSEISYLGRGPSPSLRLGMTTACTSDFSEGAKISRAANLVFDHISAMQAPALPPGTTQRTLAIIMGGGAGTRLFPLTKDRAKPAVPLGGKYRLVDIPISNCLNSGFRQVYVLTQFNSESLHRHITASYKFDNFTKSFVEILAAQQTPEGASWYQGTADAVRQNLRDFLNRPYEHFLILSGDQLYRMDYLHLLQEHLSTGADITLGTTPVDRRAASGFGIMHSDADRRIYRFEEKPKDAALLDELRIPADLLTELGQPTEAELYQGSMGIYVFNRQILIDVLDSKFDDFGKHIIPASLQKYKVFAYIFQGYWEDIGTVRAFFEANLALTDTVPAYNFFDRADPIYTHARFLPASKVNGASIRQAIVADGCILTDARIDRAVIGLRSVIESGATIRNSVLMGADFYEG